VLLLNALWGAYTSRLDLRTKVDYGLWSTHYN